MGAYIQRADLERALGPAQVKRLYDDRNLGVPDESALNQTIDLAEAEVHSYLMRAYPRLTLPVVQSPASNMLKAAALAFAVPMSFMRHPESVKTFGDNPRGAQALTSAHEFMERLCTGKQFLADVQVQPVPSTVGGIICSSGQRTMIDSADGSSNNTGF